jgi:hypothetical protein
MSENVPLLYKRVSRSGDGTVRYLGGAAGLELGEQMFLSDDVVVVPQ